MITLEEKIRIKTTPEAFMKFWENLEENYPHMHPKDHVWVKCLKGKPTEVGCVWANKEYIGGKHLVNEKYRVVEVIPNKRIVSRLITFPRCLVGTKLILEIADHGDEIKVTETTEIGYDIPVLGKILDAILRKGLMPILNAVKAHEVEGLAYIKGCLEKDDQMDASSPRPSPVSGKRPPEQLV